MVERLTILTESLPQSESGARISKAGVGLVPKTLNDWLMESIHPLDSTTSLTRYCPVALYFIEGSSSVVLASVKVGPLATGGLPVLKAHLYENPLKPSGLLVLSMKFAFASSRQTSGTMKPGTGNGFTTKLFSLKVSLTQPVCDSTTSRTFLAPKLA